MPVRFYAPDAERAGEVIDLPSDEAVHLTRVLRLKAGAAVRVFNGRGREFDGVVEAVSKNHVRVRIDGACEVTAAEPRVSVTLAQAVLKGEKAAISNPDGGWQSLAELETAGFLVRTRAGAFVRA